MESRAVMHLRKSMSRVGSVSSQLELQPCKDCIASHRRKWNGHSSCKDCTASHRRKWTGHSSCKDCIASHRRKWTGHSSCKDCFAPHRRKWKGGPDTQKPVPIRTTTAADKRAWCLPLSTVSQCMLAMRKANHTHGIPRLLTSTRLPPTGTRWS